MTIFDVIKYQISNPPTEEELLILSDNTLGKWLESVGWVAMLPISAQPSIAFIVDYYRNHAPAADINYDIALLRKIIGEME